MTPKSFPQRKSPRLKNYDYSKSGAYFITICTHQRQHLFGDITEGIMHLSPLGNLVEKCWQTIPELYPVVKLDLFVVMPNHFHGILLLPEATTMANPPVGRVIGAFKGAVTRQAQAELNLDPPVWQGRYHDHIIRDEKSWNMIREYIQNNPLRWSSDVFYGNVENSSK